MGMITTVELEEGLCFGPLPTELMIADPAYLIAQTTTDNLSELPKIRTDPHKLSQPTRLIEWVCNLRSARCPGEQNVELIRIPTTGQSFYRTTKCIHAGQEMLVWFRKLDLQPLLIDLLKQPHIYRAWFDQTTQDSRKRLGGEENNVTEDVYHEAAFCCPACGITFIYIYPYICHRLSKCPRQNGRDAGKLRPSPTHLANKHSDSSNNPFMLDSKPQPTLLQSDVPHYQPGKSVFNQLQENVILNPNASWQQVNTASSGFSEITETGQKGIIRSNGIRSVYGEENLRAQGLPITSQAPSSENLCMKNVIKPLHYNKRSKIFQRHCFQSHTHQQPFVPGDHADEHRHRKSSTHAKSGLTTLKTRNPLVEHLLQKLSQQLETPSLTTDYPLSNMSPVQNWCARCSVTFRLTSDLVQHMRTHHNNTITNNGSKNRSATKNREKLSESHFGDSEDSDTDLNSNLELTDLPLNVMPESVRQTTAEDPLINPRPGQLTCKLCGEIFRERHHLTRHMTSHT
ncbi:unnamed protein product [Calicophoron daubneyi]|uniref:C2H2-type domain-containing protein n=1 Tax=Calicophoron daubneyi TaxID=300641 RepID=A0AAV2TN17_CALDB